MEVVCLNHEFLSKYAALRSLNSGQAEKDYYQNLVLFVLYGKISKELVFKGGTALSRCYGLNRFSEDLDFTVQEDRDFVTLVDRGLDDFGIRHTIKQLRNDDAGSKHRIKIEGPLYSGSEKTLCNITLDLSRREAIVLPPSIITIGYHMDVIPTFDVYAMSEPEIFAEKIRAVMSRESARDLYDLVFLLKKKISVDQSLIAKKLEYYDLRFDAKMLVRRIHGLRTIWKSELSSLVKSVPDFDGSVREVETWTDSLK